MEWAKQGNEMLSPHGGDTLRSSAPSAPRSGITHQGRLGRRLHEFMGEDGGRSVCRLPHPE